jgi:hypothetical protein
MFFENTNLGQIVRTDFMPDSYHPVSFKEKIQ